MGKKVLENITIEEILEIDIPKKDISKYHSIYDRKVVAACIKGVLASKYPKLVRYESQDVTNLIKKIKFGEMPLELKFAYGPDDIERLALPYIKGLYKLQIRNPSKEEDNRCASLAEKASVLYLHLGMQEKEKEWEKIASNYNLPYKVHA